MWCCSRSSCGTPRKAGEQARPLVGPNTRVITLQNGVDSVERLAPILGKTHDRRRDLCGDDREPGVIRHTGNGQSAAAGSTARRAVLARYVDEIKAPASTSRSRARCCSISGRNSCCSRARRRHGHHAPAARSDPRRRGHARVLLRLMHETIAVGRAGVAFPPEFAAELDSGGMASRRP